MAGLGTKPQELQMLGLYVSSKTNNLQRRRGDVGSGGGLGEQQGSQWSRDLLMANG